MITVFHHSSLKLNFPASKKYNRSADSMRNRWNISSRSTLSRIERFSASGERLFSQELRADGTAKERKEGSRLDQPSKNLEDRGRPLQDVAHRFPFAKPRFYRPRVIKGPKERRMQEDKKARGGRDGVEGRRRLVRLSFRLAMGWQHLVLRKKFSAPF